MQASKDSRLVELLCFFELLCQKRVVPVFGMGLEFQIFRFSLRVLIRDALLTSVLFCKRSQYDICVKSLFDKVKRIHF